MGISPSLLSHPTPCTFHKQEKCPEINYSSFRSETVKLLLDSHPELVSPYTAYGGAIYSHTPLHLASRNGHR